MSGQANASKQCEWFYIHVIEQKRRAIATVVMPDGSVRGPAEYFTGKKHKFLEEIARLEPLLTKKISDTAKELGMSLLPYDDAVKTVSNINKPPRNGPYNYLFTFVPSETEIDMTLKVTFNEPVELTVYDKLFKVLQKEVIFGK